MDRVQVAVLLLGCALVLPGCQKIEVALGTRCAEYDFGLPSGIAAPPQPPGTCMKPSRVDLGRRLFYDKRLSWNQTQSCATCHQQARAFTDARARAVGSTGQVHPRNTQGLTNVGYLSRFTWSNPEVNRLENQALIPFFSEDTAATIVEMGLVGHEHQLADRLRADPDYPRLFEEAYGKPKIDVTRIARALAVFQTTFISYRSPYDRGTMSEEAKRGESLFRSAKTGCARCHGGWNFNMDEITGQVEYANTGLYNLGNGAYPDGVIHGLPAARATQGLFAVSGRPEDRGKFRTPSLRNVAVTGPYMHDGSIATLEEAIDHFNEGGRAMAGIFAGDGRNNPQKDPRIRPLGLTALEKSELTAFLRSLTDECFLSDPRYGDPSSASLAPCD